MPAVNPRIQVMLPRAAYKALASLAKRESRSMSSIAGELLSQVLPHIGAAYELAQDVKTMSPSHLAAVRNMAKSVEQINAIVIGEMQAEARDLSRICGQCGHQMSSVAHARACGADATKLQLYKVTTPGDPRQIDVEDAIAASVKTTTRKSARGSSEQSAGRMAGKARKPPGTNRGV